MNYTKGNYVVEKVIIGDAVLYCGDCEEVLPLIERADHCITDPPFEAEAHTMQRRVKRGGGLSSEHLPFESIQNRSEVAKLITNITAGWALAFCQVEAVQAWRESFEAAGAKYRRAMVWIKPDGMPQYSGDRPGMGYETIVAVWCGDGKSIWNGGGSHGVFTFNKNDCKGKAPHPTTKPLPLMRKLVYLFTQSGDIVLDSYCGSGSTGLACIKAGRKFIGIERERQYFDIACKRIEEAYKQPDFLITPPKPAEQLLILDAHADGR